MGNACATEKDGASADQPTVDIRQQESLADVLTAAGIVDAERVLEVLPAADVKVTLRPPCIVSRDYPRL